jgi:hypothetical protein
MYGEGEKKRREVKKINRKRDRAGGAIDRQIEMSKYVQMRESEEK